VGAAWLRPIPASRRLSRPGKRLGSTRSSPRVDGWSELGRRGCRRGDRQRPAAVAAAARGEQRVGCFAGQHATLEGAIGPRECARELGLQRERPEEGVLRRQWQWRAGWLGGTRRGRRTGLNRPARSGHDSGVTMDGICRATAARPARIRPAPRTDRESAARTARYGGVGGVARGA
jgi:hypothetical protein